MPKKRLPNMEIGLIISVAIFLLCLFTFSLIRSDKLALVVIIILILSLLTSLFLLIWLLINGAKEFQKKYCRDRKKRFEGFMVLWKGIITLGVFFIILLFIIELIIGRNYFLESWKPLFPNLSSFVSHIYFLFFVILGCLIIVGIKKRMRAGFYYTML
jgi:hypothetical protein